MNSSYAVVHPHAAVAAAIGDIDRFDFSHIERRLRLFIDCCRSLSLPVKAACNMCERAVS